MQEFGRRFIFVILLLPEILFAMFAQTERRLPLGWEENCKRFVATATDEGGYISTQATFTESYAPHSPKERGFASDWWG